MSFINPDDLQRALTYERYDVGAAQKRSDVHMSQRIQLRQTVVETFDNALYFYRAAALYQLLYSDDDKTLLLLRRVS